MTHKKRIDEIDTKILEILKNDADLSMERLKDILDDENGIILTRQAIQARVKKLRDEKVVRIKGIIDYEKLDLKVLSYIFVSFLPGGKYSQRELARQIAEIPHVYGVWLISGDWDILLKVRGSSLEEIGNLVLDKLRNLEGVGKTLTSPCFYTVKEEY